MKRLLIILPLFCATMLFGASQRTVIYNETLTCSDSWSGNAAMDKNLLAGAAAGDEIEVYISSISTGAKWPQVYIQYVDTAQNWKDFADTHTYGLSGKEAPCIATLTLTQAMVDSIAAGKRFIVKGVGYTADSIVWVHYIQDEPQETSYVSVRTTMWEGTQVISWSQLCSMAGYISKIAEGDSIYVTVSEKDATKPWQQLRVAWQKGYVSFACYNDLEFPREYGLQVVDTMVTQMQASGKLYLSGVGVTVTKVVLVHRREVSAERGNAADTLWTGEQSINWSGTNEWLKLDATKFVNAAEGQRLRIGFSALKQGAQGRIVDGSWTAFEDADTYEKLPTAWGDYYEFTLTEAMATTLKNNGLVISGVGYTATYVALIDPMREYVIAANYDNSDIRAWEPADGTPNLSVTLTNYEAESITTSIDLTLMTDMWQDYNRYTLPVTIDAGVTRTFDIEMPDLQPGFYRMTAKVAGNTLCTYYIGYNPTAIVSPNDAQMDFWTFWDDWKQKLQLIPVNATLEEYESTENYTIYVVSMQTVSDEPDGDPITIKSYYRQPKTEGTHPCLVRFQGSDGGKNALTAPTWVADDDWCELIVSTRGQMLNRDNKYQFDFYAYGLGDNDRHYYRAAYLDCVRAIDFVKSRAEVDTRNVFAAGGSQGGCFTYVTAALCAGDIRAIAPSITGHADFVHTMEIVGWPTNVFNNWINAAVEAGTYADYETGKQALLTHQSYFDTKNFVERINCPVITNFSLQDQTDGPHLNIAPYNLLKVTDKQYSINPFNGHAAPADWNTTYMAFFRERVDKTPTTPTAVDQINDRMVNSRMVNIIGQRVDENYKGIVIINGQKYLVK